MSVYVFSMLLSNTVSHRLSTSATSELSERERERLENRKIFNVSPTPSEYYVRKARLSMRTTTSQYMHGALYIRYCATSTYHKIGRAS